MGTSFTHNVYFYTTLLPKNKVFTMWAEHTQVFCGTWMQMWLQFFPSYIQGEFVASPTKKHCLFPFLWNLGLLLPVEWGQSDNDPIQTLGLKRTSMLPLCWNLATATWTSPDWLPKRIRDHMEPSWFIAAMAILEQPAPAKPPADHRDMREPGQDGPSPVQIGGSTQQMHWLARNNQPLFFLATKFWGGLFHYNS